MSPGRRTGCAKEQGGDHVSQYVLWEHVNLTIGMQHLLKKVITFHKSKKDNERPMRYEKHIIKYVTGQTKEREKSPEIALIISRNFMYGKGSTSDHQRKGGLFN